MQLSVKIRILIFILLSQALALATHQSTFSLIPSAYASGDDDGDDDGDDGDDGHGDDGDDDDGHGGDDDDSDGSGGGDDGDSSGGDSSDSDGGDSFPVDDFLDYFNEIEEFTGLMKMQAKDRSVMMDKELALINQNWNMEPLATKGQLNLRTITLKSKQKKTINREMIDRLAGIKYPRINKDTKNDIAVIIANENYAESMDIPNNDPALRDAQAFRLFAKEGLGIAEGNIIWVSDGTQANFLRIFGSESNYKGQLFDWVKKDESRIYIYYAGHGAPSQDNDSFLIPSDSDGSRLDLNGYRLSTLYDNLSKIPSKETTVVLESCFSGVSQNGKTIQNASPIFARSSSVNPPKGINVFSAAQADQIASWEPDTSHGLFTQYYLKAMSGEADLAPYGNGNGKVEIVEIDKYLDSTLTYWARRYYGRDQVAEFFKGK